MRELHFFILFLSLPRPIKHLIALTVDILLCILASWLAFYLRLGEPVGLKPPLYWVTSASIFSLIPLLSIFGLYKTVHRHSGKQTIVKISQAIIIYGTLFLLFFVIIGKTDVPRTVGIIQPILLFLGVSGSRLLARHYLGDGRQLNYKKIDLPKALIYGAGSSGKRLEIALQGNNRIEVVGFLDDNKNLCGSTLNGLKIYTPENINELIEKQSISSVLLAMPNLSIRKQQDKIKWFLSKSLTVSRLPSIDELAEGDLSISALKEIDIEDLLGREAVSPDKTLLAKNIENKVVLITGAGGSIGSELSRQILNLKPKTLLLFDNNEYSLYSAHEELSQNFPNKNTDKIPLIGSVLDYDRVNNILKHWQPDIIFHAAAYKHVPLVEQNIIDGLKVNIFGTDLLVQLSILHNIKSFVLISTDKAVRPTNFMGASKRVAEMVLQANSEINCSTIFSAVRFGNVLGSSGSVIPKFKQQLANGGPLTITHEDITRYFMTISEASQLVIQATAMARGGDIFLLDMGKPVKIYDLARRMIELSGYKVRDKRNPDGDVEITIIGLRPGEKLYEELLIGDGKLDTEHPRIFKAHEICLPLKNLKMLLNQMKRAIENNDVMAVKTMIQELVPEYSSTSDIVDWVYLKEHETF